METCSNCGARFWLSNWNKGKSDLPPRLFCRATACQSAARKYRRDRKKSVKALAAAYTRSPSP